MAWLATYFIINILISILIYNRWHMFEFSGVKKSENLRLAVSIVYILFGIPLLLLGMLLSIFK